MNVIVFDDQEPLVCIPPTTQIVNLYCFRSLVILYAAIQHKACLGPVCNQEVFCGTRMRTYVDMTVLRNGVSSLDMYRGLQVGGPQERANGSLEPRPSSPRFYLAALEKSR